MARLTAGSPVSHKYAGQGSSLLLASGKLMGPVLFQTGQPHAFDHFSNGLFLFLFILFMGQSAGNILLHSHIGKQRVILEQISHLPFLRRKIDLSLAVK